LGKNFSDRNSQSWLGIEIRVIMAGIEKIDAMIVGRSNNRYGFGLIKSLMTPITRAS
jgi:hypothetical protein